MKLLRIVVIVLRIMVILLTLLFLGAMVIPIHYMPFRDKALTEFLLNNAHWFFLGFATLLIAPVLWRGIRRIPRIFKGNVSRYLKRAISTGKRVLNLVPIHDKVMLTVAFFVVAFVGGLVAWIAVASPMKMKEQGVWPGILALLIISILFFLFGRSPKQTGVMTGKQEVVLQFMKDRWLLISLTILTVILTFFRPQHLPWSDTPVVSFLYKNVHWLLLGLIVIVVWQIVTGALGWKRKKQTVTQPTQQPGQTQLPDRSYDWWPLIGTAAGYIGAHAAIYFLWPSFAREAWLTARKPLIAFELSMVAMFVGAAVPGLKRMRSWAAGVGFIAFLIMLGQMIVISPPARATTQFVSPTEITYQVNQKLVNVFFDLWIEKITVKQGSTLVHLRWSSIHLSPENASIGKVTSIIDERTGQEYRIVGSIGLPIGQTLPLQYQGSDVTAIAVFPQLENGTETITVGVNEVFNNWRWKKTIKLPKPVNIVLSQEKQLGKNPK